MLHLHDSSKRVWLCAGLLAFLFAASGAARAQGRPDDAELLDGLVQSKSASEGAKAETAGAKIETAVAGARQPEAKDSPEAKQPEAKQPGVAHAPKNAQAASTLQFSAASYIVPEGGGSVTVTVTRAGPSDSAVSVEYKAANKSASQTSDYTFAAGRLDFASGETTKTFELLITDDSYVEGTEAAEVSLSNATGDASLGNPSTASIVIHDDALEPAKNPNSETVPFVTENYNDFLGRKPDAPGLAFWTNEIDKCGTGVEAAQCREVKRINVSAAFYLSIEFQQTGFFVHRMHKAAFGNLAGTSVPVRVQQFLRDTQQTAHEVVVGNGNWQQQLASNQDAFALDFVQREEFKARYPAIASATAIVNSFDTNTGGLLTSDKKTALIRVLSPDPSDARLRASVLTQVVADPEFIKAEFNPAFVLMEYFGYLRRDPDEAGFNFWLAKLNQFKGNFVRAEMVKAFLNSEEYRRRFGPIDGANQRPVVDAGAEQTITLPSTASLNAKVGDDVLPEGRTLSLTWSKVSGPGEVNFANASAAATTATFTEGGTYVLRLSANDSQLTGSGDVTVNVLKIPTPTIIAVVSPAPNDAGWNNSDVTVTFNCSDSTSGIETCPAPVVISAETDGQTVSGTAFNKAGDSATASVIVKLDKTPPSLVVTSPADGANLFNTPATVSGTVSDALSGLANVTCNGAAATVNANAFNCGIPLSLGMNSVMTRATDVAGNVASNDRALVYTRVPVVAITSPSNLSYLNITPTTVTGTVDDPTATVTVNSVQAAVVNGGFSVALPLAEGPNVITASATSKDGATGTASAQVTLDTTPPRVTITSPPDGFTTTSDKVSVAGSINDIVVGTVNEEQAQVTVNGAESQVANRTFLAADVPLEVGENIIKAVGRDRVGNSVTTQIIVTRQATVNPHITLVSGNNQTAAVGSPVASPLVVSLKDGAGNPAAGKSVVFKVTQNDGMVSAGGDETATVLATTDANGEARANWKLGMRSGAGGNSVEAYSVGFEGTAIFNATAKQGQAGKVVVDTGNDQTGLINQPLPKPLIAVVVDDGNNRLAGVPVTFTVKDGGGSFAGQTSFTVNTDSDGRAAATLTLGTQEGNANNLVEVNFSSNTGFPASFTASGRTPGDPVETSIKGVVLDNSNVPIPGVSVRAVLTNVMTSNGFAVQTAEGVQTDAQGQFTIKPAPVGFVKLLVDGATATVPGTFPTLEYDMVTVAGQVNTVGGPVFLLPLNEQNKLCVTATTGGGTLTIPEAPGFSLTFGPGQVTFPGGSKEGCVSVTVVHGDKVPMVPGFGQQPRFIVTIQPAGAHFDTPARITLPNVDGLRPREVTEMYSFDHDIGSFVAIGTGVVSDDGRVISSSNGVGVLKAGWHCGGNPNQPGSVASLSLNVNPTDVKKAVKDKFEITAQGNPPLDGVYSWEVISTKPGDDTSMVALTSAPGCAGQSSCKASLEIKKAGTATVRVHFKCTTTGREVTKDVRVSAVDIKFLDKNDNELDTAAAALKVSKFVTNQNFDTSDPDNFKVQVTDGSAAGNTVTLKLASNKAGGGALDNLNSVTLTKVAGTSTFRSELLRLVADFVDKSAESTRTLVTETGSTVEASYNGPPAGTATGNVCRPGDIKSVNFGIFILRNKKKADGGAEVISEASVQNDLKAANQQYAQICVKISASVTIVDPPAGVDLSDGLEEFSSPSTPTAEEKALLDGLATASTADLQVFYVNQLSAGSRGEAFIPGPLAGANAKYANNAILSTSRTPFSLAHEGGHVLLNDGSHEATQTNLMRSGTSATNTVDASKRLTTTQESKIRSHPLVQ